MGPSVRHTFFFNPSNSSEVVTLIKSFPTKSSHLKTIPIFIYKYLANLLAPTISSLYNSTLLDGIFPSCLKLGKVTPIFKKDNKKEVANYRPIATQPILSKIFEKLTYNRIMSFIDKYCLFYKGQFGFRKGINTSDALTEYLDVINDTLNEGEYIVTVFLDFQKAFDTVQHDILLDKLHHLGFRGNIHSWFASYLSGRSQYVCISDVESSIEHISVGVPQGSTLGPLLFLLYINDMHRCSKLLKLIHFADDTTAFHREPDVDLIKRDIEGELVSVAQWLMANRLSFNVNKSTCMVTSNRDVPDNFVIYCDGLKLKRVEKAKFLGVLVDEKINFKSHISKLSGTLSSSVGLMRRLSVYVPSFMMRTLYFSIFQSHLIYACTVWGITGVTQLKRIKTLQGRAVKLLNSVDGVSNYKSNNILTFDLLYRYFSLIKFYDILYTNKYDYFLEKILNCQVHHGHATRNITNNRLNLPLYIESQSVKQVLYIGLLVTGTSCLSRFVL